MELILPAGKFPSCVATQNSLKYYFLNKEAK